MFDLNDPEKTKVIHDSPVDRLVLDDTTEEEKPAHALDATDKIELRDTLLSWYRLELDRQAENRAQQATDEDYYDHIQWSAEDAQALRDRGQAPIAYNVIAQTLNWIFGSEKRGRTDFKILPRGKEDSKPAEAKTKYMKYLSDVNRTPFHRSRAFEDAAKVGIGWIECGVQDEDDGEPIYDRYESWRNMLWDSASTELDGSDMRYQFRSRWVDEDIAIALFPDRAELIRNSVSNTGVYGIGSLMDGDDAMDGAEADRELNGSIASVSVHNRRRVRLIEAWYRKPAKVKRIRGGAFNGQSYDERDPRHKEDVEAGRAILAEKVMMQTRVAIMTVNGLLYEDVSPYRHNRFKFVPIWAYRRGRDGLPYGAIRGLRDIQDDINKRASKALHILSSNKVIMDEGAIDTEQMTMEEFADEVARPDAIIVKKTGKQLELNVDRELAPAHLELMSRNISMVQQVGGVTDELMGRTTNATSGVAVQARQEQGSLTTSKLFDNLRLAVQMHGELQLSLIEQFVTEEKQFRITNQRGTPEFVTMNDGLPENDITRTKADFVISEADWRATMRQAALDQLTEMLMKMPPEVGLVVLDLVVESMDVPNRDEIVKRIRAINGQQDPDATEPTPEEMQAKQAQAEQQALAQQIQMESAAADIRSKNARAAKDEAGAALVKAQTVAQNMTAATNAMTAATQVIQMPTIAKVGDNLLKQGGWAGGDPTQGVPAAPVAAQGIPPQAVQQPPAQAMPPEAPMEQPQQGA
jgi:hypothetical protein